MLKHQEQQTGFVSRMPGLAALEAGRNGEVERALDLLARELSRGGTFGCDEVIEALIAEAAANLVDAFTADDEAPAAYRFLLAVPREVADVLAGMLVLTHFPEGKDSIEVADDPALLALAGALSAAGHHAEALDLLAERAVRFGSGPALDTALFLAQRRLGQRK